MELYWKSITKKIFEKIIKYLEINNFYIKKNEQDKLENILKTENISNI